MTIQSKLDTSPIISLTTDFGQRDGYVGAIQGVILTICPTAAVTTLSHNIPAQDIRRAAFVLYQAFSYYPAGAIHCVVVDPGVGGQRRAIAVRTTHGVFVGPDNGVFSLVLTAGQIDVLESAALVNPDYQLPAVSATFHGRDIFAPAAAHIANGTPFGEFGPPATNLVQLDFGAKIQPVGPDGESRVIHIDHFGNLILDITADDIDQARPLVFTVGDKIIKSLSYTFADVEQGHLLAYVGSTRDHIEIAIRNGNAAQTLGIQLGDMVKVASNQQ